MNIIKYAVSLSTAGLILLSSYSHNEINAAENVYKSNTTKVEQGYKVGAYTKHGEKIKYVGNKSSNRDYKTIRNWNDNDLYKNAKISSYNIGTTIDSKQFGKNVYLPVQLNQKTESMFNTNQLINMQKFNNEFINLMNADRKKRGIKPLKYASYLQKGTDTRSMELAKYGSIGVNGIGHIRPDTKKSFHTAHPNIPSPQYRLAENLAMLPFSGNPYEVVSEKYLAEKSYNALKSSKPHFNQMMSPGATHVTNSIKIYSAQKINPNYESFIVTSTFDKY